MHRRHGEFPQLSRPVGPMVTRSAGLCTAYRMCVGAGHIGQKKSLNLKETVTVPRLWVLNISLWLGPLHGVARTDVDHVGEILGMQWLAVRISGECL